MSTADSAPEVPAAPATELAADSTALPAARRVLRGDYWRTMWRSSILQGVYQLLSRGIQVVLATTTAGLIEHALGRTLTASQILPAVLVIVASALVEPAALLGRNRILLADSYDHELALLDRYLRLRPSRAALLRTGQVPDRLMIDLVRYRLDTLDVIGAPVAVAIGVWAAVVAGAWSQWSLLLVALAVALPIALTAAVSRRGSAADDALRRQTMSRTAMIQEVADAHDLYWARGRASRGAARVRTDWDSFTAGPARRTLRDWATQQQVTTTGPLLGSTIVLAGGAVLAAHGLMDAGSVVGAAVLVAPVQAALEAVTTAIGSWRAREIVSRRLGWLVVDEDGTPADGATVAEHAAEDDGSSIEALDLRGVSTLMPNGRRTTPVSASLARGDVLWLRGDVGSGKTSLVRALIGLGADLDGQVLIDGAAGELAPGQVLLMPQAPSFLSGTVSENITLDRPDLKAAARGGLAAAGMEHLADQELEAGGPSLSGGERHVVAWLRHLRRTGGVRVLDEPLNGLSAEAAAGVMGEIEASRSDWITILISHDDRPARMPGAQVVLLDG